MLEKNKSSKNSKNTNNKISNYTIKAKESWDHDNVRDLHSFQNDILFVKNDQSLLGPVHSETVAILIRSPLSTELRSAFSILNEVFSADCMAGNRESCKVSLNLVNL